MKLLCKNCGIKIIPWSEHRDPGLRNGLGSEFKNVTSSDKGYTHVFGPRASTWYNCGKYINNQFEALKGNTVAEPDELALLVQEVLNETL